MANYEAREVALGRAIQHHAAGGEASQVIETAAAFAEFLAPSPGSIEEDQVRAWIGHSSANAEKAVRIATNNRAALLCALEGEWGTAGTLLVLLRDLTPERRASAVSAALQEAAEEDAERQPSLAPVSPGGTS